MPWFAESTENTTLVRVLLKNRNKQKQKKKNCGGMAFFTKMQSEFDKT